MNGLFQSLPSTEGVAKVEPVAGQKFHIASGGLLVLISAMNYFTHIGLLMNSSDSL